MNNLLDIASRLKELRLKNGLEQTDVAKHLGYKSDTTISKWENGKNLPNGGKLAKLALLFNTTTDYILHGQENPASTSTISPQVEIIQSITEISSKLNTNRQEKVLSFSKNQLYEQEKEDSNIIPLFKYNYYDHPISAGIIDF